MADSRVVEVKCDRHGGKVRGLEGRGFTSGFYHVEPPSPWARYRRADESNICDSCMHSDPKYIEAYGAYPGAPASA